jgi:transposase
MGGVGGADARTGKYRKTQKTQLREIVNAIFYVLSNRIKWRSMPHDLPPWPTVYGYFRKWRCQGY